MERSLQQDSRPDDLTAKAHFLLEAMLGQRARFRSGQWEAIERLVRRRERLLLVQRTGWGKSLVYFLATRLLRDRGEGPTLLISPLLALMRNQIEMAERIGIRAATINSSNTKDWKAVEEELRADKIDVLLVSPERLANERFANNVLPAIGGRVGLFVVDEAHCISDWGHDFRPDYRRIVRILKRLPSNIPVLATTATANSRVVEDVLAQMGGEIRAIRGPLQRTSLRLQTLDMAGQDERMAWLAERVPAMPGSGIIYCLTIPDTRRVAGFLKDNGIRAAAYWGALEHERRLEAEAALQANEVKALVATTALGMGYDKPDLDFVIHFQSPGSLVAYYQQVGRAGRALDEAYGVMMVGSEDEEINEYFTVSAFPKPSEMAAVLKALEKSNDPMSKGMIAREVNVATTRLEQCLKILQIDGAIALSREHRYFRTPNPWSPDIERELRLAAIRRHERDRVLEYARAGECLMRFLVRELDGEMDEPCGRCAVCAGDLFASGAKKSRRQRAREFLRNQAELIPSKKHWPSSRDGSVKSIAEDERVGEGYALSVHGDAGWGEDVSRAKYRDGVFGDDLVRAAAEFIERRWVPDPYPEWVAAVPSLVRPKLVADFAARLAGRLKIRFVDAVEKTRENRPQKEMENSYTQVANIWRAFAVREDVPSGPVLLVDDIVDSGWTLTCIGVKLRQAGAGAVHPFALASAAKRQ